MFHWVEVSSDKDAKNGSTMTDAVQNLRVIAPENPNVPARLDTLPARIRRSHSAISNHKLPQPGIDGRSTWGRRVRDIYLERLDEVRNASISERSILRRVSVLEVQLEIIESRWAKEKLTGRDIATSVVVRADAIACRWDQPTHHSSLGRSALRSRRFSFSIDSRLMP
jgi:hypothetical protein